MRNSQVVKLLTEAQKARAEELKMILVALVPGSHATTNGALPFMPSVLSSPPPPGPPAGRYIVDDTGLNGFYVEDGTIIDPAGMDPWAIALRDRELRERIPALNDLDEEEDDG